MNGRYALDKTNAKLMGVCAGLARWADMDPMLVRLGTIAMLFLFAPLTIMAYLLLGLLADNG